MLTTVLSFLVAIGILVVVHEFGHFLAARLMGVKVLRFAVGFGRPLLTKRYGKDQTELALCILPLGGYVKMLDEREGPVAPHELGRAFNRASVGRRLLIVAAGPIANFLLAILFYWALFVHGIPAIKPLIGQPAPNTPAAHAGLNSGDEIVAVDGAPVDSFQELRLSLLKHALSGGTVELRLRNNAPVQLGLGGITRDDVEQDVLNKLGIRAYDPPIPPIVGMLQPNGIAASAGLRVNDRVLAIDAAPTGTWQVVVSKVRASAGRPLSLEIERGGQKLNLSLTPAAEVHGNQSIGKIGAGPKLDERWLAEIRTEIRYGLWDSLERSLQKTWEMSVFTLEMMGRMVMGQVSWRNLSGPLTIADYAGQSAQMGWLSFISFLALVSISLGVLNLLPVPLLDGGHLMYYSFEVLRGRPVSERAIELGSRIGMAILFLLMVLALYNDLARLTSG
ncbi:MAG TPA: RIP metalloprotease RseP [Thiobacillaceae bacterium]|nr:RIP metalloprotease RseP [Thiobacillaceae bacterium]